MREVILGSVLLVMSIACTGCSGGGDGEGSGGSGGSGSTAPLSFDAETSLPAAGGAAAATAFAVQFGSTVASILDALGNAPGAASSGVTPKINVSGFICTGGGSADLTGNVVEGEEVKLVLNDCSGSAFGAGSVSGDITLTINEGTNFDFFNGGPIYATAVVGLDISPGGTLVGGFEAFAEASAGLAMINLRLGNQLDSDLLTWTGGGQVLQLGCFDILQRIQFPSGFVLPRGVANLASQIYTINDYATSSVPRIDLDSSGVPRAGEMTLVSGDGSVEGADRSGRPCQPFVGTPAGDNSYVDALFSAGGCISLSGAKFDGTTFESSTSWDKLLDRDFTEGGGESCGGGGTGGSGGSTTGAIQGPADCDPGSDREPNADTFITGDGPEPDRMLADTNFGASTSLVIKSVPNLGFTRKIYIVFDVANAPSFEKASLVLTVDSHIGAGPQPVNVFGITDGDDWKPNELTETEIDQRDAITWNNAPRNVNSSAALMQFEQSPEVPLLIAGYDFDLGGDGVQDDPGTRYGLDVTEYVKWAIGQNPGFSSALPDGDPDDQISILMAVHNPMNVNEDASVFFSKETSEACDRPFLHFE